MRAWDSKETFLVPNLGAKVREAAPHPKIPLKINVQGWE